MRVLPVSPAVAGCLLIMDENQRLPEWLAYHYFAMNLRYLVVLPDPKSLTSPRRILDKWRRHTDMTIVEWEDRNITNRNLVPGPKASAVELHQHHNLRQRLLYKACTDHFLNNNATTGIKYSMYIDVDEYVAINSRTVGVDLVEEVLIRQGGSVVKLLDHFSDPKQLGGDTVGSMERLDDSINSSTIGATARLADWYRRYNRSVCLNIPRIQYSAEESTSEEVQRHLPRSVSLDMANHLETMRYRYRTIGAGNNTEILLGKTFLNLDRLRSERSLRWGVGGVHSVLDICPRPWVRYDDVPVGIHHYAGMPEAFFARVADSRVGFNRSVAWERRGIGRAGGADDEIRPWLSAFIDLVGEKNAFFLLEGVGVIDIIPPAAASLEPRGLPE